MWLIILIILLVISLIIGFMIDDDFGGGIFTLGLIILGAFFIVGNCVKQPIKEFEQKQYNIQGLENNIITSKKTNGSFILGFGYVNSESKEIIKYYYFKVNQYGKKLETIEINNNSDVYIRETNDIEPSYIIRYQKQQMIGIFKWLFGKCENNVEIAEILVVPTNTIKIEYNVEIGKE